MTCGGAGRSPRRMNRRGRGLAGQRRRLRIERTGPLKMLRPAQSSIGWLCVDSGYGGGKTASPLEVTREQVLAFRRRRQYLHQPARGEEALTRVLEACPVQNTPPGRADVALHARVARLSPDAMEEALLAKTLVQAWSLRGTPHVLPAGDLAVYRRPLAPADEDEARYLLRPIMSDLEAVGLPAQEAIERMAAAIGEVLDEQGGQGGRDGGRAQRQGRPGGGVLQGRPAGGAGPAPPGGAQPLVRALPDATSALRCSAPRGSRGGSCSPRAGGNETHFVRRPLAGGRRRRRGPRLPGRSWCDTICGPTGPPRRPGSPPGRGSPPGSAAVVAGGGGASWWLSAPAAGGVAAGAGRRELEGGAVGGAARGGGGV